MELIKSAAKRSRVSDIVYIILNLVLVVGVLVLTLAFSPPYLAYLLVVISKWRVFAVRPRFWWANLLTNTVDLLVGISTVTLIWQASGAILAQLLIAILYAGWLLVLKPRSNRSSMLMQASISQFLSLTALFSVAHLVDSSVIVIACWLLGYVVARHVMLAYDEEDQTSLSFVWGFLMAELGWLAYHWTVAYDITANLLVPQVAIIAGLFGFVCAKFYDAQFHGQKLGKRLRAPTLFAIAVIAILLIRELSVIIRYSA